MEFEYLGETITIDDLPNRPKDNPDVKPQPPTIAAEAPQAIETVQAQSRWSNLRASISMLSLFSRRVVIIDLTNKKAEWSAVGDKVRGYISIERISTRQERHIKAKSEATISKTRGRDFEKEIGHYMEEEDFTVEYVGRQPHKGDLLVNDIVLVECKNYSNTIPKKERDKFLEDLSTQDSKCGLFIANWTLAKKGDVCFEYVSKNNGAEIPIAYINIDVLQQDKICEILCYVMREIIRISA
jgi:hypothetical protein